MMPRVWRQRRRGMHAGAGAGGGGGGGRRSRVGVGGGRGGSDRAGARIRIRGETAQHAEAAAVAARCAALLRGGVSAPRLFELLAAESGDGQIAAVSQQISHGRPVAEALAAVPHPSWRVLAAVWILSSDSGSPLAPALARIAEALRAIEALRERRSVLLAGPRATVRLVSALPPCALALGWVLGFDAISVLMSPLGCALIVSGLLLQICGMKWAQAMTARLEREDRPTGLELELCWVALGGGAPPATAVLRVADTVDRVGTEWVDFAGFCAGSCLQTTIRSAAAAGVPLRPLLLEEAARVRTSACAELDRSGERLGVRVLVPLGVCVLPAFVVLGVIPVLIAMLGDL